MFLRSLYRHLAMLTTLLNLFSCGPKSVPEESERFGNEATVVDSLQFPLVQKWEMPYKRINEYVDSLHILPISNDYYSSIIFCNYNEDLIFTSVTPSPELEKQFPDRAERRKPYLGYSAFNRATGELVWHRHFDEASLWCQGTFNPNQWSSFGVPYLIDNLLVVQHYQAYGKQCIHLIDPATGKTLVSSTMTGMSYENMAYLLLYDDTKQQISRLNAGKNLIMWTYNIRGQSANRLYYLCDNDLLTYKYGTSAGIEWDIVDANSGKIVTVVKVPEEQFKESEITLVGYADGVAYFSCRTCSEPMMLDALQRRTCLSHNVAYDVKKQQVIKRTAYAE